MKFKRKKFDILLKNKKEFQRAIKKTKKEYRPFDPGQYLYDLLLEKRQKVDLFSDEYLELMYTTLIAWNMNGRGAKLEDIEVFKESIRKNKEEIKKLEGYKLEEIDYYKKEEVLKILGGLFSNLKIGKTKSKLVGFSKTLHFLLPKLVVPIDRKYTLSFFYNNTQIPTHKDENKNNEKQFKIFSELFDKFWKISQEYNLHKYLDRKWNIVPTKTIDNAIISYERK